MTKNETEFLKLRYNLGTPLGRDDLEKVDGARLDAITVDMTQGLIRNYKNYSQDAKNSLRTALQNRAENYRFGILQKSMALHAMTSGRRVNYVTDGHGVVTERQLLKDRTVLEGLEHLNCFWQNGKINKFADETENQSGYSFAWCPNAKKIKNKIDWILDILDHPDYKLFYLYPDEAVVGPTARDKSRREKHSFLWLVCEIDDRRYDGLVDPSFRGFDGFPVAYGFEAPFKQRVVFRELRAY